MGTRIVQLIARYIGIGLTSAGTGLFGAKWVAENSAKIEDFSGSLAAIFVGVISLFVSELIHRAMTGGFLTAPGDKTPAKKLQEMRTPSLALLLGMGALLAFSAQGFGCAGAAALDAAAHDGAVTRTLDYVDARAPSDPALSESRRRGLLLDAALVRRAYDAALGRGPTPTAFERLYPVPPSGVPPRAPGSEPLGPPAEPSDPAAPSLR